jgi:hypothetical protein
MEEEPEILDEVACVYVTLAAAQEYARTMSLQIETARRDLTVWLLDARRVVGDGGRRGNTERWRRRGRMGGGDRLDVDARVAIEDGLAVVVSVQVRRQRAPRGGRFGGES